jgi:hypothetical protein
MEKNKDLEVLQAGAIIGTAAAGGALMRKLIGGSDFTSALAQISGAILGGYFAKKAINVIQERATGESYESE